VPVFFTRKQSEGAVHPNNRNDYAERIRDHLPMPFFVGNWLIAKNNSASGSYPEARGPDFAGPEIIDVIH
jgi:hypothetical protein